MRWFFGFLSLLMLLFVGVQYNDPDGLLWMVIYAVPALACGLVAWRSSFFTHPGTATLLLLALLGAVAGMAHYWPRTPEWWQKSVWWEVESAREGMGMMIIFAVLVMVWLYSRSQRKTSRQQIET